MSVERENSYDMEIQNFISQKIREDILKNIFNLRDLKSNALYTALLNDGEENKKNYSRRGFNFETIASILICLKTFPNLLYSEIHEGRIETSRKIGSIKQLLDISIEQGGNITDFILKLNDTAVAISFKYWDSYSDGDVVKIKNRMENTYGDNFKIAYFVKDKHLIENHRYIDPNNEDKFILQKIIQDGLLFDEKDVIHALDVLLIRLNKMVSQPFSRFLEFIDQEYLLSSRIQLYLWLHQKMGFDKIIEYIDNNIDNPKSLQICIDYVMRSGKTIEILLICKYLIEKYNYNCLIFSNYPSTFTSYYKELDKFIEFRDIVYQTQEEFTNKSKKNASITFLSNQYSKINQTKKIELINKSNFNIIVFDESQTGSCTDKTIKTLLETKPKITMFASGTSDKSEKTYQIDFKISWKKEDIAYVNLFLKSDKTSDESKSAKRYLIAKHGEQFIDYLQDSSLNSDYGNYPTSIKLSPKINDNLVDKLKHYNTEHNTDFGIDNPSLFKLKTMVTGNNKVECCESLEVCKTTGGKKILKYWLEEFINNDPNKDSIMTEIEKIQSHYSSRKSKEENPLIFLVYLPTNIYHNKIDVLQKTLVNFLKENNLWSDYYLAYSNANGNSIDNTLTYNNFIDQVTEQTKKENKVGSILFVGNQGGVGSTYNLCDVTIDFSNCSNIDNHKQREARSETPAKGKTISINVDLNRQRAFTNLNNMVFNYKKYTGEINKTNKEILQFLYKYKIFLFNPQDPSFNYGDIIEKKRDIYFQEISKQMLDETLVDVILENIDCGDDLKGIIGNKILTVINVSTEITENGIQQDVKKAGIEKIQIDAPILNNHDETNETKKELSKEEEELLKVVINKTAELCKTFMFPIFGLLCKSYQIYCFKELFVNIKTKEILKMLIEHKIEITLNELKYNYIKNIMETIIDNNHEVVDQIREIYLHASPEKLRQLIAKHFIPTREEQKKQSEFPTSVCLIDNMLLLTNSKFWETLHKVLEPCCGKGNFVLAIFDRFYNGLKNTYPDQYIRCKKIINECLYYGDISPFNVFVTTELLKCHIQSYCAIDDFSEFNFQTYSGNLLDNDKNGIDYTIWKDFDAVIGNPPYDLGKNHNFYIKFIDISYDFLKQEGILLFVIPNRFLLPKHSANNCLNSKFQFLDIYHTTKEFNVSTDIGYFMALKNDKDKIDNTSVKTVFKNDEIYYIDLNIPTPTKTNDYNYKTLSDKILLKTFPKINFLKANDYLKQKEEEKNLAIFVKRQWKRFSPNREKGGSHIFQIIEDYENELDMQKPDGSFIEITESTKDNIIWYLSRSKIIRFITAIYASNMNVPPFMWESIPKIDFTRSYTDNELFILFNITDDEVELMNKIID